MDQTVLAQLKAVYRDGFPQDSESAVEYFFSRVRDENSVYISEDETIISAGYIIEKPAVLRGTKTAFPYLSALSTLTKFRGQGKIKQVIAALFSRLRARGATACALYPFSHTYYLQYGFQPVSFCADKIVAGGAAYTETVYPPGASISANLLSSLAAIETDFAGGFDNRLYFGEQEISEKIREFSCDGVPLRIFSDSLGVFAYVFTQNGRVFHYATNDPEKFARCESLKEYAYFDFCIAKRPYIQARILSAKEALSAAPYVYDIVKPFKLRVTDELIVENNATFAISAQNGKGSVTVTDGVPDRTVDIGRLAELIFLGDGRLIRLQKNLFSDQY